MGYEMRLQGTVGGRGDLGDAGPSRVVVPSLVGRWRRRSAGGRAPAGACARLAVAVPVPVVVGFGGAGAGVVTLPRVYRMRTVFARSDLVLGFVTSRGSRVVGVVMARERAYPGCRRRQEERRRHGRD